MLNVLHFVLHLAKKKEPVWQHITSEKKHKTSLFSKRVFCVCDKKKSLVDEGVALCKQTNGKQLGMFVNVCLV